MATFDDLIQKLVQDGDAPGFAMLAKDKTGAFQYSRTVGNRSLEPGNEEPVRLDTVFALASASKLITTVAALQAVDLGLLKLDDDVSAHVPVLASQDILCGFTWYGRPKMKPRRKAITLRGLLTQTVGAGYDFLDIHPLWRWRWWNRQSIAQGDCVEERFNYPLLHEPGEGWTYGSGITWAGKVLEAVSGMTLEEWVKEHICRPLGLTSLTFFPDRDPEISSRTATTSHRNAWTGKLEFIPGQSQPLPIGKDCLGGEGVYATIEDLVAIVYSLLTDDEKLLKTHTAAMMFTRQLSYTERIPMRQCLSLQRWICQGLLVKDEYEWTIGGVMVTGEGHQCLRPGTLLWTGLLHTVWWIDRKSGICGAFSTQILPAKDKVVVPLMKAFQEEVYVKFNQAMNREKGV